MVLPLKLTQFYGNRVPRPQIYSDVKFNRDRVDPPPSANDALLHWARQAHWSMGGLSSQRLRMQGKIEGSVLRLRAQKEKDARRTKSSGELERVPESDSGSDQIELIARSDRVVSTPRKRKRDEYGGTPVSIRQLRSEKEDDSPKFVPATEERKSATSVASRRATRSVGDAHLPPTTPASGRKSDLRRSSRSTGDADSPSFVPPSRERKRSNSASLRWTSIDDTAAVSPDATPLKAKTKKSAKKLSNEAVGSTPAGRKTPLRKMLLQDDSSDSDDRVEESPKQKDQPLRKSARLGLAFKAEKRNLVSNSASDSE